VKKLKNGQIVRVLWYDAFMADSGWIDKKDLERKGTYPVQTIGFVIGRSKKYLVLAGDKSPSAYSRVFHIPLGMIEHIKKI